MPDDALIFREGKPFVPVVRDDHLRLAAVTLGYDNGVNVQITAVSPLTIWSRSTSASPRAMANRYGPSSLPKPTTELRTMLRP